MLGGGGAAQILKASLLVPLEGCFKVRLTLRDEHILLNNFDIPSSITLHFQDLVTRNFSGGDVCLFERMFLDGLHLPFSDIAREL